MSSLVFMRVLENAAVRYDIGMAILSLGRLNKIRREICRDVKPGSSVLDIGCGTGTLSIMLSEHGHQVIGVDLSTKMLSVANSKRPDSTHENNLEFKNVSALELDEEFEDASFDCIVSTLMFSELSDEEQRFVLRQCNRMLKPNGRLILGDEIIPTSLIPQIFSLIIRIPLLVATYIISQNSTKRIRSLAPLITRHGFIILNSKNYLFGGLGVIVSEKSDN